jgi:TctA family transporter
MNLPFLPDGVGLVSIALGCFGIAEITKNLDNKKRSRRSTARSSSCRPGPSSSASSRAPCAAA